MYKKAGKESIAQIEAEGTFTKSAWKKTQKDAPAISICISHVYGAEKSWWYVFT